MTSPLIQKNSSEIVPLLGETFLSGSHKARVVEVSPNSGKCYVMAEQLDNRQRWPITVALVMKLIRDSRERLHAS